MPVGKKQDRFPKINGLHGVTFSNALRVDVIMNYKTFQQQIVPLREKLFRLAFSILHHSEEAADVVQEIMMKTWKHWGDWEASKENLEAWCFKMTRNLAIDKTRTKRLHYQGEETLAAFASPVPGPHQIAEQRDTLSFVQQLMQALPEQQRMVLHLRDVEEYSYQEIADMLAINLGQVKTNLFRARKTIQEQIIAAQLYEKRRSSDLDPQIL
jgi:RNA polymerase sigma factor (sigma-70 family)